MCRGPGSQSKEQAECLATSGKGKASLMSPSGPSKRAGTSTSKSVVLVCVCGGGGGSATQSFQKPVMKEYTLNCSKNPCMI